MKYLVFNLVVAAALIYLINGPEGGLDGFKEKAMESVDAVKAKAEALVPPQPKTVQETVEPQPVIQARVEPEETTSAAPKLPEPIEVPKLHIPEMPALSFDPIPEKPREEVAEPTLLSIPNEEKEEFMSAKDRHKALLRLAEDMEYFSAESMSQ